MKIILSHDIDHMTFWEHYKDLIVPKHYIRNHIELFKGTIPFSEYAARFGKIFTNKWQNVNEIMDLHDSRGIKSTFFMGVSNGKGLSYSLKHVKKWAPLITQRGFEAGVHGIAYDAFDKIKYEHDTFSGIVKSEIFGIRMHYLRQDENTFSNLAKAGYLYDCSKYGYENPYKIDSMWEFPLQIMDSYVFNNGKSYQSVKTGAAIANTIALIEKAEKQELKYLNILFHDCYYTRSYFTRKKWYVAILDHLQNKGYEFITYKQAVAELNAQG